MRYARPYNPKKKVKFSQINKTYIVEDHALSVPRHGSACQFAKKMHSLYPIFVCQSAI